MAPTSFRRAVPPVIAIAAGIGLLDAVVGRSYDHVVLHGLVVAGLLVLLASSATRRIVPVRGDLYRWLDRYAAEGGEEVERVVDRAISAYRDGFTVSLDDHAEDSRP